MPSSFPRKKASQRPGRSYPMMRTPSADSAMGIPAAPRARLRASRKSPFPPFAAGAPAVRAFSSSHSMELPEHGSLQPAPRRAPTCWSAVLRQDAPTQASSNTSSSDRLSRGRSKPCFWDQSGQEKHRSLPSWAATSGVDLTFATHLAASPRSECQIQNSTST